MSVQDIDRGFKQIQREMAILEGSVVSVGFQGEAAFQPAGDGGGDASIVDVAVFNEFGTETIPERPFMRQAFDSHESEVNAFIDARVGDVLDRKLTAKQALSQIGIFAASLIQRTITESPAWAAPNEPSTIAAKGSTVPLIDTGRMRQSVTWVVKKGEQVLAEGAAA